LAISKNESYSLEGTEAMIPAIDTVFRTAANMGIENIVIAMPHRGRLNFLTGNINHR
jgi:probable 2-oxoglutarate dehydrogenase E1 component DHKTD1